MQRFFAGMARDMAASDVAGKDLSALTPVPEVIPNPVGAGEDV